MVHVAFTVYPVEDLEVTIEIDGVVISTTEITVITFGTPFWRDIACDACYTTTGTVAMYGATKANPTVRTALAQDVGFAITSFSVIDGPSATDLASFSATLTGLEQDGEYGLVLSCRDPRKQVRFTYKATGSSDTVSYTALPGTCTSVRYLTMISPDSIHQTTASFP